MEAIDLDTSRIKTWRSIVTLIVFVITNINVLFPFSVSLPIPLGLVHAAHDLLAVIRILPTRHSSSVIADNDGPASARLQWFKFPFNYITTPIIADLFLLAILAIGRQEVHDGTVGANHIDPINIMVFFISLAYIAISIDASGLIRWLAYKVLQKGGGNGRRLYLYLYAFFFGLSSFIGNDPVILSGTPFLAYMTRISRNIEDPRAWLYTQFALANIASAILVSSNPTNLVLAGAFGIKFIDYTANIIVPVIITVLVLCPFLLSVLFRDKVLIPPSIKLHELPEEVKLKKPANPNIPKAQTQAAFTSTADEEIALLEEILNPFLDKPSAIFGSIVMAATLVTILAVNAATPVEDAHPVWWITLPAAVVMFIWDLTNGWMRRHQTRLIFREAEAVAQRAAMISRRDPSSKDEVDPSATDSQELSEKSTTSVNKDGRDRNVLSTPMPDESERVRLVDQRWNLVTWTMKSWKWLRVTFPTATMVLIMLPLPLVPFSLAMFVLVQALVTRGWVPVFAYGWNHWVNATGTVGAAGGIAFLAIILCNFAGTNIGTTILLSRVLQAWVQIHKNNGSNITNRTFWVTVYSMSLGLNYGAFSLAFSASLAGLLWRNILARKHVHIRGIDFMRINFPIIALATAVGCGVLVGEVYIVRKSTPYIPR